MARRRHGRMAVLAVAVAAACSTSMAAGGAAVAASAPLLRMAPNHRLALHGSRTAAGVAATGWSSSNWSGYAVTSGAPYTKVTSVWVVPKVAPSTGASFSAAWVGIDGFNNASLIQAGTEQDYYLGAAHYNAWWTTSAFGFIEQPIGSLPVKPGDLMVCIIGQVTPGTWVIIMIDATSGKSFVTATAYSGPGASAEWILEAPSVNGTVAQLASYGATRFDAGTVNGVSPGLTANDGGVLVQNNVITSTPSAPDVEPPPGTPDGFNIARGSTAPPAPSS